MSEKFNFESLVSLCGQTHEAMQTQAARSINIGLVGRGFSERALEQCRKFYQTHAEIPQTLSAESQLSSNKLVAGVQEISQAPSAEFNEIRPTLSVEFFSQMMDVFKLSWSHYVVLLTLDDPAERSFYEIEAAANRWSVRELEGES
jgi:hypothetical protein